MLPGAAVVVCLGAAPAGASSAERPIQLWPLAYHRKTAESTELEILFPLIAYRRAGSKLDLAVRPFYWKTLDPARGYSRWDVLWPLAMRSRERETSETRVLPFYYGHRSPSGAITVVFPLVHRRAEGGRRRLGLIGLLPLVVADFERADGFSSSSIFPLGAYSSDAASLQRRVSALGAADVFNLVEKRTGPGLLEWHALNLWVKRSAGDRYAAFWPFYIRRDAGSRTDLSVLWPLYGHGRSEQSRYRWLLPFYLRAETKESSSLIAGLAYSFADKRSGTLRRGLFPLYHGTRGPGESFDLAFPYWRYTSTGSATTAVFPLYLDRRSGATRFRVAFPLYFAYRDGYGRDLDYFFPLYGTVRRGETVTRRFLFFPLYSHAKDEGMGLSSLDVAWPLFHQETSSTTTSIRLLPLYWKSVSPSRTFEAAFPVYWRFDDARTQRRFFLPFYWSTVRPDGDYRRYDVLLSLYARTVQAGSERSRLFPIYWRWSSPDEDRRYLPPLGGREWSSDGDRELFFVGATPRISLFQFSRSPRFQRRTDRALLYYRRVDRTDSTTVLFPFYQRRDPQSSRRGLFPLFDQSEDRSCDCSDLAFLGVTGGWSLFELSRNGSAGRETTRALLYYRRVDADESRTAFAPLYWRIWSPGEESTWLIPLFSYQRDDHARERRLGVLGFSPRWSVFSRSVDGDRREGRFLYRLVRWHRDGHESSFELNPLFYSTRSGDDRYWALLGGLFGVETDAQGRRDYRFLWVF